MAAVIHDWGYSEGGNFVATWQNNGNWWFQHLTDDDPVPYAADIVSSDFGRDGYADFVVSSHDSIFYFNGALLWWQVIGYPSGLNGYYGSGCLFVGDLNGDNYPDIATGNTGNLCILMSDTDGGGLWQGFKTPVCYDYLDIRSIAGTDLDNDGDTDLFLGQTHSMTVLKNNGLGSFSLDHVYSLKRDDDRSLLTADLNGDGRAEIILTDSNRVAIWQNRGADTLELVRELQFQGDPGSLVASDLNNDGLNDLAVAIDLVGSDQVAVLMNYCFDLPPSPFSLTLPLDKATIASHQVDFAWEQTTDPEGDPFAYALYLSRDSLFNLDSTTVYPGLSQNSHSVSLTPATYYWKVRAYDSVGAERWSTQVRSVTIAFCCNKPGDANNDNAVNVGDAVYIINYIFKGGPAPSCMCEGDANCDFGVNIGEAFYIINYVFKSGPPPWCNLLCPICLF